MANKFNYLIFMYFWGEGVGVGCYCFGVFFLAKSVYYFVLSAVGFGKSEGYKTEFKHLALNVSLCLGCYS